MTPRAFANGSAALAPGLGGWGRRAAAAASGPDEQAPERPVLTVAQVFELADRVGRRPVGNIRKVPGNGYRLRFRRDGEMRTSPEVYDSRATAARTLWKMADDGRADCNYDRRYRALVLLATFASLRWGEVIALRRRDLDLEARAVRIRAAYAERSTGEMLLGPPKSRAGRRVVGIPDVIIPALREHLRPSSGTSRARSFSPASMASRCGEATSTRCLPGRTLRNPSALTVFTFMTCGTQVTSSRPTAARPSRT